MGITDYFFEQIEAINRDREEHLHKLDSNAKKCQDVIIKHVLRDQFEGYKNNLTKASIFTLIDNFVKDHVKNDSKHLDLFHESQENVKLFFLGLANITTEEIEH